MTCTVRGVKVSCNTPTASLLFAALSAIVAGKVRGLVRCEDVGDRRVSVTERRLEEDLCVWMVTYRVRRLMVTYSVRRLMVTYSIHQQVTYGTRQQIV
jgi:hypothetical protein